MHAAHVRVIRSLFPDDVVASVWDDADELPSLHPEEESALGRSVEGRRREFAKGRACARRALEGLGIGSVPIPVGAGRAPLWPAGVVGSITHCDGLVAAVVAPADKLTGIGLDVEADGALPEEVAELVCTAAELRQIRSLPPPPSRDWQKVYFSAKESVHKVVFPHSAEWLDFVDVELSIDTDKRRFTAGPARGVRIDTRELTAIRGRFEVNRDLVFTGAVLP